MTKRELKVLEDELNQCVDEYDFVTTISSDPEWVCTKTGMYSTAIKVIKSLHILYHKEYVKRIREGVEYTTIHYTLYTD